MAATERNAFFPSIGIFSEGTATVCFTHTLREVFQPRALLPLSLQDLCDPVLMSKIDLLVLPGVASEESPYRGTIDGAVKDSLFSALEGGMGMLLSCAAAYHFCDIIHYNSPAQRKTNLQGLSLFEGQAYGPVDGEFPVIDPEDSFSDTRVLRVHFNDRAGRAVTTGVCYGNGPAYYPTPAEEGVLDVIARYADVIGNPVAVAGKAVGKGFVVMTGVLPEIALEDMRLAPGQEKKFPRVTRLRDALAPHEAGRRELMKVIAGKFQSRWQP
jgi:glutamine amidotransferase-like uncharacterized protein